MRERLNVDVCDIMERANEIISCISGAVLAIRNAKFYDILEEPQDSLTMLHRAETLIAGTDRDLRELELKIARFRDDVEDAILAEQSMKVDV